MIRAAALALGLACCGPVVAAECRLALVLALDVSSSVDRREDALQRGGLAAALRAPEVAAAFFAADDPVALAIYEWSGLGRQTVILDWVMIDGPVALDRAAGVMAASTRATSEYPTAMGHALTFGAEMLARGPRCLRQVIDVSGDGQNNEGYGPRAAYDAPEFAGVTVNGLVVNAADFEGELGLIAFYRGEVLHGPGAFMVVAEGFADYARAMRAKLVREIAPTAIGRLRPKGDAG